MRRLLLILAALAVSPLALANPTSIPTANLTLTAGGAPQTLVAAGTCNGILWVNNALEAANEGAVGPEPVFVTLLGSAASGGGGPSIQISPGVIQPLLPQGNAVSWVAATTGHKINAFCQ